MGVWSFTWPVHGSFMIIAWSATWVVHDSHVITAWSVTWSVHDHSCDQYKVAAWSVYDQPSDQCMIATWSVHDQTRDQCMISHVIRAWSVTWSVYDQPRDQCMISHMDIITNLMGVSLSKLLELVMDREACCFVVHGVAKSCTWLSYWTEMRPFRVLLDAAPLVLKYLVNV